MKNFIVTIDGPAASGKEKISKFISRKWKLKHLDSGILYRRLALIFFKNKLEINDVNKLKKKLSQINKLTYRKSKNLRLQEIGEIASKIANDLPHGSYVNLGIGMPELISQYVDKGKEIIYHSENGLLGMGPPAKEYEIENVYNHDCTSH